MRRSASEIIRNLQMRIARLERRATSAPAYDPGEKAHNRQKKISHLLRIILDNCTTLNDFERKFISNMLKLLNKRVGIEPSTALTEKQARTLRKIIYKRHSNYKHAVPRLPAGVDFEGEVRRLLKSKPNPNQVRNELIKLAQPLIEKFADPDEEYYEDFDEDGLFYYENVEQEVSYVRTVKDGSDAFLIFNIKHSGGSLPDAPRWDQEINEEFIVAVRVDPKFLKETVLEEFIAITFAGTSMENFPDLDLVDIAIENARYVEEEGRTRQVQQNLRNAPKKKRLSEDTARDLLESVVEKDRTRTVRPAPKDEYRLLEKDGSVFTFEVLYDSSRDLDWHRADGGYTDLDLTSLKFEVNMATGEVDLIEETPVNPPEPSY